MRWITKNTLTVTTALLILLILGVAGAKLSPLMRSSNGPILPVAQCDPGKGICQTPLPNGAALRLSIEPRPIRALQNLILNVQVTGMPVEGIEIDFDGSEMQMGYNRPRLHGRDGQFSGQAMLPVCVTGSMEWVATVLITVEGKTIAQPFHFQVEGR